MTDAHRLYGDPGAGRAHELTLRSERPVRTSPALPPSAPQRWKKEIEAPDGSLARAVRPWSPISRTSPALPPPALTAAIVAGSEQGV